MEIRSEERKKAIFVVEDSVPIAMHIKMTLESAGFLVPEVLASGEAVLESLRRGTPDLILMDIILEGELDGIETAGRVAEEYGVPVVYVSANSNDEILDRAEKTAPYGYIIKPINERELIVTVKTALSKHTVERTLIDNEKKYRSLFENMSDVFLYAEAVMKGEDELVDALVVEANSEFYKLVGKPREEVVGRRVSEIFPLLDEIYNDWRTLFYRVGLEGEHKKIKAYFPRNNQWFRITAYSPGRGFISLIAEDVTVVERGREILKKSEEKYKKANRDINNILASIDSILIGVSIKDEVTLWNDVAEKVLGIPRSGAVGVKFSSIPINWAWDEIFEGISESIVRNSPVVLDDMRFVNAEGGNRYLGITINPILDDTGGLSGFLIYGRDITKKRLLEIQLLQDQKLKSIGELASGIAHEINTPTQYVINNTHFLRDAFSGLKKLIDYCSGRPVEETLSARKVHEIIKVNDLNFMLEEAPSAIEQSLEGLERIAKIVSSMKSFAYPEHEKKVLTDINKAVRDTITISKNEWKYIAAVETRLDESLCEILGFPAEINQALLNLIVNASHAIREAIDRGMIEKGKISIGTSGQEGYAVISVSDNGIGIRDEIKSRVFDPFFTTKEVGKGTGQGLSITYSIVVDKHKGKIFFESRYGSGTTFNIHLPYDNQ